jgi:apolipoprotein N-acyltransferase
VAVAFSMPPWGWWPLAFVGIALFDVVVRREPSRRRRALLGFVFGAGWMYPAMAWMWFLTVPGYLVACAAFAGYHAAAAAAAPTGRWGVVGRPAAHTLAEIVRFAFPFGGVPLASIGISQADGPLLGVARIGGVISITWLVWQVGAALAAPALVRAVRTRAVPAEPIGPATGALAVGVVIVLASIVAPEGRDLDREPLDVAAVQGGGEQGTRALDVPSSLVTGRHLEATRAIDPDRDLDVVVWPENAIDVDGLPFVGSPEYDAVLDEVDRLGVPFSVGVTIDSEYSAYPADDSFVNAQLSIVPGGDVIGWYEKVRIVPFGEYVPMRGLLEALGAPLENVAADATSGRDPAVLPIPRDDGRVTLGVMISWEVFFGDRGRAGDDAMVLINPTNGASYTWTILQTQQIAASRLRAVETGRWVVQVAPTGFSAFVGPDGSVLDRTAVGERAVIRRAIPLRTGTTVYSALGDWPWRLAVVAVLALAWAAAVRRAAISRATPTAPASDLPAG